LEAHFGMHPQFALIDDSGFSPLMVTSSIAMDQQTFNQIPRFNDGLVYHAAPTAKGMSGGPCENNQRH